MDSVTGYSKDLQKVIFDLERDASSETNSLRVTQAHIETSQKKIKLAKEKLDAVQSELQKAEHNLEKSKSEEAKASFELKSLVNEIQIRESTINLLDKQRQELEAGLATKKADRDAQLDEARGSLERIKTSAAAVLRDFDDDRKEHAEKSARLTLLLGEVLAAGTATEVAANMAKLVLLAGELNKIQLLSGIAREHWRALSESLPCEDANASVAPSPNGEAASEYLPAVSTPSSNYSGER